VPLARFTIPELHREVLARGIVAQISGVTLWRWLSADALQPWRHRSWIFPRDPQFADKAGRVLDLYARVWEGLRWGLMNSSSRLMRNRVSKRVVASIRRSRQARLVRCVSNTSTFEWAR